MQASVGKAQLLETIANERSHWEQLLAEVGESRMLQPALANGWSFKDVAAHLVGWRRLTIARLEAPLRGEEPAMREWPVDPDEDLEGLNRWMYETNRDRPLAEVLADSRRQFDQMAAAVERLSDADLAEPGRFAWMPEGAAVSQVLGWSFEHLHEEHEPDLRAWLAGRQPAPPAG